MRASVTEEQLTSAGVAPEAVPRIMKELGKAIARQATATDAESQVRLWGELRDTVLRDPATRWTFGAHLVLYRTAYAARRREDGPGPAWWPSGADLRESNIARLMADLGIASYADLHRWSTERREEFWATVIATLGIVFRRDPDHVLGPASDVTRPDWLPGASLNIAESCFRADASKPAILYASEADPTVRRVTYGELLRLAHRVARGLEALGTGRGERVALYMPMTPEAVGIYLGTILAGRVVVGIADAIAPQEFEKRARIGGAKLVFTVDGYVRDEKRHRIYDKVVEADGPRAVLAPVDGDDPRPRRKGDVAWEDFLGSDGPFEGVPCRPADHTNILFSSGTTKDPKAIPWTHVTPIKGAADAYLHHDVRPSDVLAWPTSFGWMMGPWLTYASLVNRATMALYLGAPQRRDAGEFLVEAGVTVLGIVPKIVRSWKEGRTMEGLDWSRIRLFSSTAEPSSPEEMLYLMFLAGYKPIIEYCGGTEIGGGYITGTVVQPCAPSTFTTPALGLDLVILDDGQPADRGEVFLVPPSIGLSNELLNHDHDKEYYASLPRGPHGEVLRRHGDQIERLPGGFFRHHGRIDDMINIGGVKTSAEEIRSVLAHDLVYDAKPTAVDVDGSGQHALVIYAVPRDLALLGSADLRERLRGDFRRAIKERLNPLLSHIHDVVLVPELPQAGPGKTRTMRDLQRDYRSRVRGGAGGSGA